MVRILMEDAALAQRLADFLAHAKEHGDVLKAVQAVGDEEGHDDDIRRGGELGPFRNEGGFLHVGVDDFGEAVVAAANEGDLILNGLGGVLVEAGAVADDDEAGLLTWHVRRDFIGTLQQQSRHVGVDAHGIAVMDRFAIAVRGGAVELKFAREHLLAEVAFADEIRHDVDDLAVHHLVHLAHVRLFFPEAAGDFTEEATAADGVGVQVRRGAGVRVRGGTVTDDDEGGVGVRAQEWREWGVRFVLVLVLLLVLDHGVCAGRCGMEKLKTGN